MIETGLKVAVVAAREFRCDRVPAAWWLIELYRMRLSVNWRAV